LYNEGENDYRDKRAIRKTSMKKRFVLFCCTAVICLFGLMSCTTTTVMNVWKDKDYQGKPDNIIVIMVTKSPVTRELVEGMFVAGLDARGNNAVASYRIIPIDQLTDRDIVESKIRGTGADAVLVSRLVDQKTMKTYDPGVIYAIPDFYYDWWGYYDYVMVTPGYTDETQVLIAETNMYDIKTEKLIWSARSETEVTEGDQQLIKTFVEVMIHRLASNRLIK
jgi:hypothetical protein